MPRRSKRKKATKRSERTGAAAASAVVSPSPEKDVSATTMAKIHYTDPAIWSQSARIAIPGLLDVLLIKTFVNYIYIDSFN